jgi:hypothetical protein
VRSEREIAFTSTYDYVTYVKSTLRNHYNISDQTICVACVLCEFVINYLRFITFTFISTLRAFT